MMTAPNNSRLRTANAKHQTGFTLMELLVVIALLGILAGAAIMAYAGVQEQGRDDVTRFQMAELRQALLRFRSDSGSRDFPGQGQYDCEEIADEAIANGRPTNWPAPPEVPTVNNGTKADWIIWCQHPANFWMLFVDPLGNGWDADRKRGWNGPYLQRKRSLVDVPAGLPAGQPAVNAVWGIADAYLHDASAIGISWDTEPNAVVVNGPYLLLGMSTRQNTASIPDHRYDDRILSLGENGTLDEPLPNPDGAPDPNPNPCQPHVFDATGKPLDYILCLLR